MSARLFIVIRSDLESLTVGKAAAQVAHAASQASKFLSSDKDYQSWENGPIDNYGNETHYAGFGTTIVLDGGSFENTLDLNDYSDFNDVFYTAIGWGVIKDPTYPLRDGRKTHYIDLYTCFWVFYDPETNKELKDYMSQYKLYNGNHT